MLDLSFLPHYHYKNITDITLDDILSWGVRGIAIDIDNTVCYDATTKFIGSSRRWIEHIVGSGIPVVIISNANKTRAIKVAKLLGLPCVPLAKKPKVEAFVKGAELVGLRCDQMAFIGDQIFSDVKGANDAGMTAVYVEPPKREIVFYFFYRYRRWKERPYIKAMLEKEQSTGVKHKVK